MSEELKQIYSKFLRLYEKLAEEREIVTQQGIALGKIINALDAETKLATEFKVQVRTGLNESISQATKAMGNDVKNALQKNITGDISTTIQELKMAVTQSVKELEKGQIAKKSHSWYFLSGVFLAAIIVGIVLGKWVMPYPLSDRQFDLYSEGKFYEKFWDKISKKERVHLNDLMYGRVTPDKDSIEWLMKKYPNMKLDDVLKKFNELGAESDISKSKES